MLLDTNILIYACKPGGEKLSDWTQQPDAAVSIITRIEALGYSKLDPTEGTALRNLFSSLPEYPLNDAVAGRAIELRRQQRMDLADAIIAATALEFEIPLVTRNVDDYTHIEGLSLVNPFNNPPK